MGDKKDEIPVEQPSDEVMERIFENAIKEGKAVSFVPFIRAEENDSPETSEIINADWIRVQAGERIDGGPVYIKDGKAYSVEYYGTPKELRDEDPEPQ